MRLLWPVLLLLVAFVVFFELIAEVGGSAEPMPSPPVATPTATVPDDETPQEPDAPSRRSPGPPGNPPGRSGD